MEQPIQSPSHKPIKIRADGFAAALNQMLQGRTARREGWENQEIFLAIKDDFLVIYDPQDKEWHPLIVSVGDIVADDWEFSLPATD